MSITYDQVFQPKLLKMKELKEKLVKVYHTHIKKHKALIEKALLTEKDM